MDVGNIGYPKLVDAITRQIPDQVGINPEIMLAISFADPFTLAWPATPAFLTHDPGNFLMVDDPTFALQLFGYPSISIAGKVQANLLHAGYQRFIRRLFL